MSTLKVGVIGVGTIGTIHSEAMQATGEAELAAFCDIDAEKLAAKASRFGVKNTFADYRDMLKSDIEAVVVGVPNYLHRQMALDALAAGKHVLLEKPMTMNAAQAADVVAAVKKSGKVLTVGMCNRQQPQSQAVREYVATGQFGKIYHMRTVLIRRRGIPGMGTWFTTKSQCGGGPMIDLGVHWFDLSMFLSGNWKPTSVSAATYAKFGPRMKDYVFVDMWAEPKKIEGVCDVEDYSTGLVRFEGGCTMVFDIVWAANAPDQQYIEIMGDKGGAPPGGQRKTPDDLHRAQRQGHRLPAQAPQRKRHGRPGPQVHRGRPRRASPGSARRAGPDYHEAHRRDLRLQRSGQEVKIS